MQQHLQLQRSVKLLPLPPGIRTKLDNGAFFTIEDVQRACAAGALAQGKRNSMQVCFGPLMPSHGRPWRSAKAWPPVYAYMDCADAQMTSIEVAEVQRVVNDVVSAQKSPLNGALRNSCTACHGVHALAGACTT